MKLFLVKDIDENHQQIMQSTNKVMRKRNANQLKRFSEAQKVVWIETKRYLEESIKSGVETQGEYNW